MTLSDKAAILRALLELAAATGTPLETLGGFVEDLLDAAQCQFATTPVARLAWSEEEQTWLLSRAAALLERDIQRYPRHHYRVHIYLDRDGEDSEFLGTHAIDAPTGETAVAAVQLLTPFGLGFRVEEVRE